MATRDLAHRIAIGNSLGATLTATTNGSSVDTLGYESLTLYIQLAAIGGTAPSFTFNVQTSADGSTNWLNVDATVYMGGVAPAAMTANGQIIVGLRAAVPSVATPTPQDLLRFVRAVATITGTSPTALVVASFILGHPRHSGVAV